MRFYHSLRRSMLSNSYINIYFFYITNICLFIYLYTINKKFLDVRQTLSHALLIDFRKCVTMIYSVPEIENTEEATGGVR